LIREWIANKENKTTKYTKKKRFISNLFFFVYFVVLFSDQFKK